jgi:hypothetical protein
MDGSLTNPADGSGAIKEGEKPNMQNSTATPRFPHAGWLGAKMKPWLSKKTRRTSQPTKRLPSQEDLEKLRQKFAKQPKN